MSPATPLISSSPAKIPLPVLKFIPPAPPALPPILPCRVQLIAMYDAFGRRFPVATSATLVPASSRPATNPINLAPAGFFNSGPVFNCWLPASAITIPGDYRFSLDLQVGGMPSPHYIDLGTRTFWPSADLRLLIVPAIMHASVGDARSWGSDLTAQIPVTLRAMQRFLPMRTGVGSFRQTPGASLAPSLRYLINPGVINCASVESANACDVRHRTLARLALVRANASLLMSDPSGRLDRFDNYVVTAASTGTGGGQSQRWSDHCSSCAGFDNGSTLFNPSVLAHEVLHCLGEVSRGSPHNDGGSHSRTRLARNPSFSMTLWLTYSFAWITQTPLR